MNSKLGDKSLQTNTNNIVLIGMPGSGKSSIGSLIANILRLEFCDLDKYIEAKEQATIPQLFLRGEDYFRQLESKAAREIHHKQAVVISTGGGIVTRLENMILLRKTGTIFYIERSIDLILRSIDTTHRPLLAKDGNRIYTLYEERKNLYEQYCHFRITNDQSLDIAANKIIKIINQQSNTMPIFNKG